MGKTKKWLEGTAAFVKKNWFIILAIGVYVFFTFYYMGPGLLDCKNTINGFGDSTGGPIWRYSLDDTTPLTGFEKQTNYPFGETLTSPVDAAVIGQTLLLWSSSKVAGPVCGYNIVNALGYFSTALVMFGFILSLTRNRWIALLAGYAVSFTPYLQVKVGAHPGYGFGALLIGVLWVLLSLIKTQRRSRAVILALLVAACFYFDPYFSLLAASLLIPIGIVLFIIYILRNRVDGYRKAFQKTFKLLGLSITIMLALVAPLLIIMVTQADKISTTLTGTRDNISDVARLCSNWPHEYALPFPDSYLFDLLGSNGNTFKTSLYSFSTCGIAEDSVGIGLSILTVVGIGGIVFIWERLNKRNLGLGRLLRYDPYITMFGLLAIILFAGSLAFPPVHIFGLPSPSQILISFTSTWRIISREYMIINLSLITLFSIFLAYFSHRFTQHKKAKILLFVLLAGLLLVQYQTYRPFGGDVPSRFSYDRIPSAYSWLKAQNNIHAVVEYPIEIATESNSVGYYLTMQSVHKKPLLNSALASSPQNQLRSSIKNIKDPQTVKVLKYLGVDTLVIHGVSSEEVTKIPYLEVLFASDHGGSKIPESQSVNQDSVVIAKIKDAPILTRSFQFIDKLPYNSNIQHSVITWQYEVPSGTRVIVDNVKNHSPRNDQTEQLCINVAMAARGDIGNMYIINKSTGEHLFSAKITSEYLEIKTDVPAYKELSINNDKGFNMRITKIGCE